MIIERFETREHDDHLERSAVVRYGGGEARLSVSVPAPMAGDPDDASPFVPIALLPAMSRGEDLIVDGPVSPRLLRGLSRARELYRAWSPPLHDSRITVAEERASSPGSSAIGLFFSRGVDSTYSAAVPRDYPGPLGRLVFITGFAPEHDDSVRAEEIRRAGLAAERIGLPMTVVSTSFFDLTAATVNDADDITSPGLALAALALGGALGTALFASSDSTDTLGPFGTSPVLDPLFSTEAVALEVDSVALGRVDKTRWLARERPDLLAQLKVCYAENRPDNCGSCAKCLLTVATLEADGALGAAEQFADDIDLDAFRAMRTNVFQGQIEWARALLALEEAGKTELHAAILEAFDHPPHPYPGPPPRDDTPAFRARHNSLLVSVMHHRRPWPPPGPFAMPPGVGLVRSVDAGGGRHVYGVGRLPPGVLAGELGSLPRDDAKGLDPVRITAEGYLTCGEAGLEPARRSPLTSIRWALAPLWWRAAPGRPASRARAAAGRLGRLARPPRRPTGPVATVAYLHRHEAPGRLPLYSAIHHVTGDQLLTTNRWEAVDMGYGDPALLGYLDQAAPVTGSTGVERVPVPWASRFGLRVRS